MVDWLFGWLVKLFGCLIVVRLVVGCQLSALFGWLFICLLKLLVGWLSWLVGWLFGFLVASLSWLVSLVG